MDDRMRYECIDPDLGDQIGRLEDPDLDDHLRARLLAHCDVCAACRLQREFDAKVTAGLRDGSLTLAAPADNRHRFIVASGLLALAAGLALLLLLPPREKGRVVRAESGEPVIERPISEEVVDTTPSLRWTAIEDVSSYNVVVTSADGDFRWSVRTSEPRTEIPADAELPRGRRYRLKVEPIPAHRAPEGGLRTAFRTGGIAEIAAFRLGHGPLALWALALAGFLAMAVGGFLCRSRR